MLCGQVHFVISYTFAVPLSVKHGKKKVKFIHTFCLRSHPDTVSKRNASVFVI